MRKLFPCLIDYSRILKMADKKKNKALITTAFYYGNWLIVKSYWRPL